MAKRLKKYAVRGDTMISSRIIQALIRMGFSMTDSPVYSEFILIGRDGPDRLSFSKKVPRGHTLLSPTQMINTVESIAEEMMQRTVITERWIRVNGITRRETEWLDIIGRALKAIMENKKDEPGGSTREVQSVPYDF